MPKFDENTPARPTPTTLPPLATAISLVRVQPEQRAWRFYRMEVWPDLFGRALLMRHWGRIGTEGRRRLDPHPDAGAAIAALNNSPGPSAAAAMATGPRDQARLSGKRQQSPRHRAAPTQKARGPSA
jgi:predicted DNA-binding WGR domain protein